MDAEILISKQSRIKNNIEKKDFENVVVDLVAQVLNVSKEEVKNALVLESPVSLTFNVLGKSVKCDFV